MSPERSAVAPVDYDLLCDVDWSFSDAATQGATHGIHPYPAKFIPQIPRTLIRALHPGDDSHVMDPFCGSGTTLVEAGLAGVPAVGIDLHPLACLMSKVKTTPLPAGLAAATRIVVSSARDAKPISNKIPRVDHWFRPEVQQALAALINTIDQHPDSSIRDAMRVALSSIIVRVSNQESDTRYAAIDNPLTAGDVFDAFERAAESTGKALHKTWAAPVRPPRVKVLNRDILAVTPDEIPGPVSLVVTSPPYPNAYEYWLYHKYRMYWLGMDPLFVREREIGARPNYFKRNPQTAEDFAVQMATVFDLLADVLVSGGHVCLQIGDSVIHGKTIDNADLVTRSAIPKGFRKVLHLHRSIPSHRKAFNPSHGRIREESILVFRREIS